MSKRTLSVTVNGRTYTRTTSANYTHAIVTTGTAYGHKIDTAEWRSSLATAQSRLSELNKSHAQMRARGGGDLNATLVAVEG